MSCYIILSYHILYHITLSYTWQDRGTGEVGVGQDGIGFEMSRTGQDFIVIAVVYVLYCLFVYLLMFPFLFLSRAGRDRTGEDPCPEGLGNENMGKDAKIRVGCDETCSRRLRTLEGFTWIAQIWLHNCARVQYINPSQCMQRRHAPMSSDDINTKLHLMETINAIRCKGGGEIPQRTGDPPGHPPQRVAVFELSVCNVAVNGFLHSCIDKRGVSNTAGRNKKPNRTEPNRTV